MEEKLTLFVPNPSLHQQPNCGPPGFICPRVSASSFTLVSFALSEVKETVAVCTSGRIYRLT